jgi:DNA polymerase III epsilon subunit-like protein
MKYVSLDLETTCISPKKPTNILMVSMVLEDTNNVLPLEQLPHFTCFVKPSTIEGSVFALSLNDWILGIISERHENKLGYPIYNGNEWIEKALGWLKNQGIDRMHRTTLAGKNVATFDLLFLPREIQDVFNARVLDPGSVFADFSREKLMSLQEIKDQLGVEGQVTHNAYEDALDVIKILRKKYETM